MNDHLTMKALKEIGLTEYESKCYQALLEKKILTVTEISKLAGIPRTNAYDSLEKLLSMGFCVLKPGRVKGYSAMNPSFLKERVLLEIDRQRKREVEVLKEELKIKEKELFDRKKREFSEKKRSLQYHLDYLIKELTPQYQSSQTLEDPLEYIEIMKDNYQSAKRCMQLCKNAEREIVGFSFPPRLGGKITEEQASQQAEMLKKNILIKSVYEIPEGREEKQNLFQYMDLVSKHGEEGRVIDELPIRMMIIDESIALIALEDPIYNKASLTSLLTKHKKLAKTFRILFEVYWQKAEDYHVLIKK